MDLQLYNLRTGEMTTLDPDRTLVGSADHATVRTGGPFLAALTVRYPSGWVIHGLSDDPSVRFNREPLRTPRHATPRPGDQLDVGEDRFRFVAVGGRTLGPPAPTDPPPTCFAYIVNPDGLEECRVLDHDLLIGRMSVCHVRTPDKRLSRLTALLAAHAGVWYVHSLSRSPIVALNYQLLYGYADLHDGDELLVGPLTIRIEMAGEARPTREDPRRQAGTDIPTVTIDAADAAAGSEFRTAALNLDRWLKGQTPARVTQAGLAGWLGAQRAKLGRFWYDTPETMHARGLRTAGRYDEAFAVLDKAIRARPDSPDLLRELYRLHDAAGLIDLCYRPLRHIEKLANARGTDDTWVLEELARLCERLGKYEQSMFDRAISYWNKLEAVTGVSYARERSAAMATRTLREGGFTPAEE